MKRIAAAAVSAGLVIGGCGGDDTQASAETPQAAQRAVPYAVHWVGRSFAGLPLTAVLRDGSGDVTVIYGTCKPKGGEGGCAPPLQIQSASICDRNALLYTRPPTSERLRGAVARRDQEGDVRVDTGVSNVTVFAGSASLRERALAALRPVDGPASAERLDRPRYPRTYVAELRRVQTAHRRLGNVRAVRDELGISKRAVRFRLALARELGARRLRRPADAFTQAAGCAVEPVTR